MRRRKAREYVLQFLYGVDFISFSNENYKKEDHLLEIRDNLETFWLDAGEKDPNIRVFTEDIIFGTIKNLEEIDSIIQKVTEKWEISRIASIDRNIMRFATYELLYRKDIPVAVTINEAIEISKKYSTLESAAFINGILDKIAEQYKKPNCN